MQADLGVPRTLIGFFILEGCMETRFYLMSECARELRLSVSTIRQMERDGTIKATGRSQGGTRFFSEQEVRRVQESRDAATRRENG